MANQAVDIVFIGKIKVGVFPAVANMAGGAGGPVSLNTNAEVIDAVFFAGGDQFLSRRIVSRLAFPGPVDGVDDLVAGLGMTFQAGFGDVAGGIVGAFEQLAVVGVRARRGDVRLGVVAGRFGFRAKEGNGNKDNE